MIKTVIKDLCAVLNYYVENYYYILAAIIYILFTSVNRVNKKM